MEEMQSDDPWDWDVNRVVKELCTDDRTWRPKSATQILPDATSFELTLRENDVNGSTLLTEIDTSVLKSEFNLKSLNQRGTVMHAIGELRAISREYKVWAPLHHPERASSHPALSLQGSYGAGLDVSHHQSHAPALHHESLVGPAWTPQIRNELVRAPDTQQPGDVGDQTKGSSVIRREELNTPVYDESVALDSGGVLDSSSLTLTDHPDTPSKKPRRIAPTLISSVDIDRERQLPSMADHVIAKDPSNVQVGVVFRGEDGRKRLMLALPPNPTVPPQVSQSITSFNEQYYSHNISDLDAAERYLTEQELATERETAQVLAKGYLGSNKHPADSVFYGTTKFGRVLPSIELNQNFSMSSKISCGRRRYVHSLIKRYLSTPIQRISRHDQYFSVQKPYPSRLIPPYLPPSFSLFHQKPDGIVIVTREPLTKWPEIEAGGHSVSGAGQRDVDDNQDHFHLPPEILLGGPSSYDMWDIDNLEKYKHLDGGDEVLPLFGESGSENDYDLETWAEIDHEQGGQLKMHESSSKKAALSKEDVDAAIDEGVAQMISRWHRETLPRMQKKAWGIWMRSRKHRNKRQLIQDCQVQINLLKTRRIPKYRQSILDEIWHSKRSVRRQAEIMQQSIADQEAARWRISVLESKEAPEKPPPRDSTAVKIRSAESVVDENDDEETLETPSEVQSSEDDLDDFIVEDEGSEVGSALEEIETDIEYSDVPMEDDNIQSNATLQVPPQTNERATTPITLKFKGAHHRPDEEPRDIQPGRTEIFSAHSHHSTPPRIRFRSESKVEAVVDLTALSSSSGAERTPQSKVVVNLVTPSRSQSQPSTSKRVLFNPTVPRIKFAFQNSTSEHRSPEVKPDPSPSTKAQGNSNNASAKPYASNDVSEVEHDGSSSEELEEDLASQPHRKRHKLFVENLDARNQRERVQRRVEEESMRRRMLRSRLGQAESNTEDPGHIIINEAKHDEQGFIYVHDQIGRRIKNHQVEGVRFMWSQLVANDGIMQGCLLAHTMGLGKTMQAITFLVAVAQAATSSDETISSQIPEGLRLSKTLILCPPGLIDNWYDELLTWVPEDVNLGPKLKVGSATKADERYEIIHEWFQAGGVLIIGYEMFRNLILNKATKNRGPPLNEDDHAQIHKELTTGPNIVIADEAHKMKNSGAATAKATVQFTTKSRIALTASPLANNIEEYHTMIDWVAPNYLGPIAEFRAKYVVPIQEGFWYDSTPYERRRAMKMLRVLNTDLAPKVNRADMTVMRNDLPPKIEFVITVPLTDIQEKAYTIYVQSMVAKSSAQLTNSLTKSGDLKQTTLWHWLAILSLLCNHPACFRSKLRQRKEDAESRKKRKRDSLVSVLADEESSGDVLNAPIWKLGVSEELIKEELEVLDNDSYLDSIKNSYKVQILVQILDHARAVQDKVLIFSQSLPTLDFLEDVCKRTNRKYARLDGSTVMGKRQSLTKQFNTGDTELYLISTNAGGLGLNLYGANRVVIFDFKFNPINEQQAVGRAYRIGQKKSVFVYRFIAGGTFEERIHNKTVFKTQLASRVVDKKNPAAWAKRLAGEFLFKPRQVPQEDLTPFRRLDPDVLDRILDTQGGQSTIRAIVMTDTFERHDNEDLTADEEKEVKQLVHNESLKRNNPQAYKEMLARREDDLTRRAFDGNQEYLQRQGISHLSSSQLWRSVTAAAPASQPQNPKVSVPPPSSMPLPTPKHVALPLADADEPKEVSTSQTLPLSEPVRGVNTKILVDESAQPEQSGDPPEKIILDRIAQPYRKTFSSYMAKSDGSVAEASVNNFEDNVPSNQVQSITPIVISDDQSSNSEAYVVKKIRNDRADLVADVVKATLLKARLPDNEENQLFALKALYCSKLQAALLTKCRKAGDRESPESSQGGSRKAQIKAVAAEFVNKLSSTTDSLQALQKALQACVDSIPGSGVLYKRIIDRDDLSNLALELIKESSPRPSTRTPRSPKPEMTRIIPRQSLTSRQASSSATNAQASVSATNAHASVGASSASEASPSVGPSPGSRAGRVTRSSGSKHGTSSSRRTRK